VTGPALGVGEGDGERVSEFERDPKDWLRKFSPQEWIQASLGELRRAEESYKANNAAGGLAGCKRAAGMALNAALILEPQPSWGRSYVDHVMAVERDLGVPAAVREACKVLLETHAPGHDVLTLRSRRGDERVLEAAKDVMAHAYSIVKRHEPAPSK
jgi:HEPN domain-containing protein